MDDTSESPTFPRRAVLGLCAGFAAATLGWNLLPFGPADVLPSLPAEPSTPPIRWPDEAPEAAYRVVAVGLSTTVGYPYLPLGVASFATLCDVGLTEVGAGCRETVRIAPLAMDSADAPTIVELCRRALEHSPDLLVVELGANEASARVFSGEPLLGDGWLGWVADRFSRARLAAEAVGDAVVPVTSGESRSPLQTLLDSMIAARPGEPLVDGLPVSARDLAAIAERLERAVEAIADLAADAGVDVVLWPSPYDLRNAWPLGMLSVDPVVDDLVARHRAGERLGGAERVALEARAQRADVQHLLGRLATADGDEPTALAHFERARDVDPAPMHVVGAFHDVLVRCAARHEHVEFADLARGLDSGFIDVTHPEVRGQRQLAARLRDLLIERGVVTERDGCRASFEAAIDAHLAARLPREQIGIAEGKGARIDVMTHMAFGAVRDALPRFGEAFAGLRLEVSGPTDPDWLHWIGIAAVAASGVKGDLAALGSGTPEERARRLAELSQAVWHRDPEQVTRLLLERAAR